MFRSLIAFILRLAKLFTGQKLITWLVGLVWGLVLRLLKLITGRRAFPVALFVRA